MRRREFVKLLGVVAVWPTIARAQQERPVIGFLSAISEAAGPAQLSAFRRGLGETGFVEGQNVTVEYRWAEGKYERLPAMAAELVRRPVSLILAQAPPAALSAKAATASIPIVFVVGLDPVGSGLVSDMNKPGGNATGMTLISTILGEKRIEMVRDLAPKASVVGMLVNPVSPDSISEIRSVQTGAQALGLKLAMFNASTPAEIEAAFDRIASAGCSLGGHRSFFCFAGAGGDCCAGRKREVSDHLSISRVCRRWRLDELRRQYRKFIPAGRHLCGENFERCFSRRAPRDAADNVRASDKPQDRGSDEYRYPRHAACAF
jgi:putative ABC transport system substrate-binding protein